MNLLTQGACPDIGNENWTLDPSTVAFQLVWPRRPHFLICTNGYMKAHLTYMIRLQIVNVTELCKLDIWETLQAPRFTEKLVPILPSLLSEKYNLFIFLFNKFWLVYLPSLILSRIVESLIKITLKPNCFNILNEINIWGYESCSYRNENAALCIE